MKLTKLAAALTALLIVGSQAVLAADEAKSEKAEGAKTEAKKAPKKEKAAKKSEKKEKEATSEKKEGEAK